MEIPSIKVFSKNYQPSNTIYDYMYSIAAQSVKYSELELKVLNSNGYDSSYPTTYCQNVVFGGVETSIDDTISWQATAVNPMDMPVAKEYSDTQINLADPVKNMYSNVTLFSSGYEFGQDVDETVPAKVVIDNSGASSVIKWYKNGNVVATETLGNKTNTFALAVVVSGNTITSYAYIYYAYYVRNKIFTSGVKSNADILAILNAGGFAGENTSAFGWQDEEKGEFVISKIFKEDGTSAISGVAAGGRTGETIPTANDDLINKCEQYGGYIGTDIIEYMTGLDSANAWIYLTTNPAADGLEFEIPTNMGTYKLIWSQQYNWFDVMLNGTKITDIPLSYRTGGHHVYLTWYQQSGDISNATQYMLVDLHSIGGDPGYMLDVLNSLGSLGIDYEDLDNNDAFERMIDGYNPDEGQEDEEQEDPDDVQDPDYDALASGFLYAFMVDAGDMVNLADSLVPDTLAQKIRADFGNNLFEFIVSYHIMPCLTNANSLNKVAIAYRGEPFLYGENNTQLTLAPISQSFYTVSCGTKICLPTGTRQNGFENWAQANVQLYLPFIGYVHLNTADVWGKAITISYKFDILQGTCVANIGVGKNGTLYSYEGACKYSIPFTTAIDHSNMALLSGIMSTAGAAVSLGGAIAGGSPSGLLNAAGGISSAAGSFLQAAEHKSLINRGGCLSGAPGWQMPRHPALIITVPNWISPGMVYNDINGYPTYKTGILSGWLGNYVEVSQIDLRASSNSDGASPNDSELDMINSILKGGVYV